jgi:hypothetical protein
VVSAVGLCHGRSHRSASESAHHPFGVGMAFGVVGAGQGLLELKRTARRHKGQRGRLAARGRHERAPLPLRETGG